MYRVLVQPNVYICTQKQEMNLYEDRQLQH